MINFLPCALFLFGFATQQIFGEPFQIKGEFSLETPKRWNFNMLWRNPYPSVSFSDIFYEDEVVFSVEKYSPSNAGDLTLEGLIKLLTNPKAPNPFKVSSRESSGYPLYEREYVPPPRGLVDYLPAIGERECYQTNFKGELVSVCPGIKIIKTKDGPRPIHDEEARESYRRIAKKLKSQERETIALIKRNPRTFYVLRYRAPRDVFEQYWKDFLNFLQSFRLNGVSP